MPRIRLSTCTPALNIFIHWLTITMALIHAPKPKVPLPPAQRSKWATPESITSPEKALPPTGPNPSPGYSESPEAEVPEPPEPAAGFSPVPVLENEENWGNVSVPGANEGADELSSLSNKLAGQKDAHEEMVRLVQRHEPGNRYCLDWFDGQVDSSLNFVTTCDCAGHGRDQRSAGGRRRHHLQRCAWPNLPQ